MAKDLVRTRRYVKKFILMKANIQAVSLKIQTLKSQDTMAQAMKGVTKAMRAMNSQVIAYLVFTKSAQTRNTSHYLISAELAPDPENHDGIRKTIRNNGHERRDDG